MNQFLTQLIPFVLIFILGLLSGYYFAYLAIDSQNTQALLIYTNSRERLAHTPPTGENPNKKRQTHRTPSGEDEDLDDNSIIRHLGSRGTDSDMSQFAEWRADEHNQNIYWQ